MEQEINMQEIMDQIDELIRECDELIRECGEGIAMAKKIQEA